MRAWHADLGSYAPILRAHCYGLLRTILATAVQDGLLPANPCHIRGAGNSKRVHKVEPATLGELEHLVAAMPARYPERITAIATYSRVADGQWLGLVKGPDRNQRRGSMEPTRESLRADDRPVFLADPPGDLDLSDPDKRDAFVIGRR